MKLSEIARYHGRVEFVRLSIGGRPLTFLDVGNLGDGSSTNLLNKQMVEEHGGTYFGLDSNEGLTKKMGLPNQRVGDIHATDFESDQFDMVYLGEVIEHTWTPAQMVRECRRILKPGGELVLDTPNPYSLAVLLSYIFQRRDSMGDNRALTYHEARSSFSELKQKGDVLLQPQHKIFFTSAMMRQMLETQGFVVTSIGFTQKKSSVFHQLLLPFFPQLGQHLCVRAKKATVEEAFKDVL